jgi:hypothetical protein
MRQPIRISVILAYFWIMMIMLGSIVMETFMIYPNVFNDRRDRLRWRSTSCGFERQATSFRHSDSCAG